VTQTAIFNDHHPDPRRFQEIRLCELQIDVNAQRNIREWKVTRMMREWNWVQVETPTVTIRDGHYYVIEGQHRVTTMQRMFSPDAWIMCAIVETTGVGEEAEIALAITRSRHKHTALEAWRQAARAGFERECAANDVLEDLGLSLGDSSSRTTISAAHTIHAIVYARSFTTSFAAAEHLRLVLTILLSAYPDDDESNISDRFDNRLIQAVNTLLHMFPLLDSSRLADRLARRPAAQWISAATGMLDGPIPDRIARKLLDSYNHDLRSRRLTWKR
jgi:hypothetical protein